MNERGVVRYRPPCARVSVAYSTKDRVELTRVTLPRLLDAPDIDLYWFDGSVTDTGRQLPLTLCPGHAAICELHQGVIGGPDAAIMYALQTLRRRSYDLIILIENDVLLMDGWHPALCEAIVAAERAGFRVGAASVRVFRQRVLSFNGDFCLLLNAGAGFLALTPAAADIVLANYRTGHTEELVRLYRYLTGVDFASTHDMGPQPISADWFFDVLLYLHGYVVSAPPITFAKNIDPQNGPSQAAPQIGSTEDHLPSVRGLITRPEQIRQVPYRSFRFQKSLLSDRLLIGCHQLAIDVGSIGASGPLRATGPWWHRWMQFYGPFTLFGAGQISIATYGPTIGLALYTGDAPAAFRVSGPSGYGPVASLPPNKYVEFAVEANIFQARDAVIDVVDGQLGFIGLTVPASVVSYYANQESCLDHLPL